MSLPLILAPVLLGNPLIHKIIDFVERYGIAPKFYEADGKIRIEVFNPCDESDDQKTPTAILFDDDGNFIEFGSLALQEYAEILDDGGTAPLF